MRIIDAHQHFWRYSAAEYEWIDASISGLRRDFLPADLLDEMAAAKVSGSVAVQARQTLEETRWLLRLAEEHSSIRGVVGWAPIGDPTFLEDMEEFAADPRLKGLRHVVQAEPDGFLAGPEFNAGISSLKSTGLSYDILIVARQLPQAIEFVDRHPNQIFILDHLAKPAIAKAVLEPWAKDFAELARREHVYCKLSGLVTEADWHSWTVASLLPYVEVALEAFGPQRLMVGSDWPVCTVASIYSRWFETLAAMLSALSDAERDRIFAGTAIEAYRLIGD